MGDKREREAERVHELHDALAEVSAALATLADRLPDAERIERLAPIVVTDRAMLHALAERAAFAAGDDRGAALGDAQAGAGSARAEFAEQRARLVAAMRACPPRSRLPWHGGPMTVEWAARNRLAVTWCRLDELADASGSPRPAAQRSIVELALELVQHSFLRAGLGAPDMAVAVELTNAGDEPWVLSSRQPASWPPTKERVTGPAIDLCRLACGRTTRTATELRPSGDLADLWLDVVDALAYSDPPP